MHRSTNTIFNTRWDSLHANLFREFIIRLDERHLKYFILRNFEGLPDNNYSKDIDIIIEPGSYKKASGILYSVLKDERIKNYYIVKYERVRCWFGIDTDKRFSIHIDLIEGYLSKGFEIFSFDLLFQNTVDYNGIRVLNNTYDVIMLLYYKVIGTKQLKEKYRRRITLIYSIESENIDTIVKKTTGDATSQIILNAIKNNDFGEIEKQAKLFAYQTKKKVFFKYPVKTTINIGRFFIEKFYRIVICPRKFQNFLAIIGPDGSGKSTFIDGLLQAIGYYYVSDNAKSHVYHFRPTIFPNLGAAGEKVGFMKEDRDFTNPHRGNPTGFLSSLLRMGYYWLDYAIGVPLKLRKDVQFDLFTIYDRYIYDFLIDPKRSRIYLPYWIRKIFSRLVIQPRIVFVLLTDAETIYARKQELSLSEINRQLIEYRKLANSNQRFIILDASKPPEQLVKEAIDVIIDKFTRKIK